MLYTSHILYNGIWYVYGKIIKCTKLTCGTNRNKLGGPFQSDSAPWAKILDSTWVKNINMWASHQKVLNPAKYKTHEMAFLCLKLFLYVLFKWMTFHEWFFLLKGKVKEITWSWLIKTWANFFLSNATVEPTLIMTI